MDPREYQLTTRAFNVRFSCNPSRQTDDGDMDGVYAAIDAALEKYKIAKDERAAAQSPDALALRRWRTERVFRAFQRPVPPEALENPPTFVYEDRHYILEVGGCGYAIASKEDPSEWYMCMLSTTRFVRGSRRHCVNNCVKHIAEWLRTLVEEFGALLVFEVFKRVWDKTPHSPPSPVEKVLALHGLDPPATCFSRHAKQDVDFAVILRMENMRVVVGSDRILGWDCCPKTPWAKEFLERDDAHAILLEIIKVL